MILPVVSSIWTQTNKFATGVWVKATCDSRRDGSPGDHLDIKEKLTDRKIIQSVTLSLSEYKFLILLNSGGTPL